VFREPADYELLEQGAEVVFSDLPRLVASGSREIPVTVAGRQVVTILEVSERQRQELLAGGTLNYVRATGADTGGH
jgi:aconitate hydratase